MENKVVAISLYDDAYTLTKYINDMNKDGWEFVIATDKYMFFKRSTKRVKKNDP